MAQRNRPPVPPSIERREFKGLYHRAHHWLEQGRPDLAEIARAHSSAVDAADTASGFKAHNDALEAAVELVGDIESEIVYFEPRSVADLRLQVELALHQEVVDHGMYDRLPQLICERFMRLIPGTAV